MKKEIVLKSSNSSADQNASLFDLLRRDVTVFLAAAVGVHRSYFGISPPDVLLKEVVQEQEEQRGRMRQKDHDEQNGKIITGLVTLVHRVKAKHAADSRGDELTDLE